MSHILNNNLSVSLGFGYTEQQLINPSVMSAGLEAFKAGTAPGFLERVIAISFGDEDYTRLKNKAMDSWTTAFAPCLNPQGQMDRLCQINLFRDLLNTMLANAKQHFPGAYTFMIDGAWNDLLDYGIPGYTPPPAALDVLGMNPYFGYYNGQMRFCDSTTQANWNAYVDLRLNRALTRFTKPIILVGQSFADDGGWGYIPAPCQLEWWYQKALQHPSRIPGILWFAYAYDLGGPGGPVDGVRDPRHAPERAKLTEIFIRNYQNRF